MDERNLKEIFSVVNQVLNDQDEIIMDETFFNDEDEASICFTMKDYNRPGGLATFLANVHMPGEKEWKANKINQAAKQSEIVLEKIKEFEMKRRHDKIEQEEIENKRMELITGSKLGFHEDNKMKAEDSLELRDLSIEVSDRTHVTDRSHVTGQMKHMKSINNDTKDMNNSKVAFFASEQREGGEDE